MNAWLTWDSGEWWHIAGWTMLHYLWIGALAGLAAGVCRLALRRAPANVRYATALASLALLAALPVGIATWLATQLSPQLATQRSIPMAGQAPIAPIALPAPGSAGGSSSDADTQSTAIPIPTPPTTPQLAVETQSSLNPRPSRGLTDATAFVAGYLPWAWIIGTPLTFLLLATGVIGAERLRRSSDVVKYGPLADTCARLSESLRIGRHVTIALCERIAAPVLVGIVRPIILLPPAALTGWSPDEIEMVLLHELAHVRRWDNLVNLVQRFIEAAFFFHPAVWLVSRWIRTEREACCDAVVVGRTNQPHAYAEMLVALAAQMPRSVLFHPAATSAMAAGPLRSRIRSILSLDDDPMLISGKSLGVVMSGLLLVATLVVLNLPTRGQAEESKESAAGARASDQEVADALDAFRKAIVGYDLDFDSVFPQRGWNFYDAKRLERYPTPNAWPDVLGHVDADAAKFHVIRSKQSEQYTTATDGNAFLLPLSWSLGTENYATLLFLDGIEYGAHVVAHSYTSFASFGPMAGNVLFKSYATALVDGDLSGQVTADSYFNLVVTGKFTGRINTSSYAMVYLMGGFDGEMQIDRSKVFIAGRTTEAQLSKIRGPGMVFLESSDLPSGVHKIGKLEVTVTRAAASPFDDTPYAGADDVPHIDGVGAADVFAELSDVPFVLGVSHFEDGDAVKILSIRGTASTFAPGNVYWIKGTYTLGSRDQARLGGDVTAQTVTNIDSPNAIDNATDIARGHGEFELKLDMRHEGVPHVSFYENNGRSFGDIYFGTGASVLTQIAVPVGAPDAPEVQSNSPGQQSPSAASDGIDVSKLETPPGFRLEMIFPHPASPDDISRAVRKLNSQGINVHVQPTDGATLLFIPQGDHQPVFGSKLVKVPFVVGAKKFVDGDSIEILEIRGTADTIQPVNGYLIKARYTLASHDRAQLSAFTTASNSAEGTGETEPMQTITVNRGSGEFALWLPMTVRGWPHLSFYPADGGGGFGGVYFGTGDSVLKKWWGEEIGAPDSQDAERLALATSDGNTNRSAEQQADIGKMRAATMNNLKDQAIGLLNYQDAKKSLPPRATFDANGKPLLSWRVLVLPYLPRAYLNPDSDEAKLYKEFHLDEPWDSAHNRKLIARMPKVFKNPRIDREGFTNYLAVVGKECVFDNQGRSIRLAQITDGTSNTISLVEANADRTVEWTKPQDWDFDREHPIAGLGALWGEHWYAAWVDGHVSSVPNKEAPDQVGIQFTRAGGEIKSLSESAGKNEVATYGEEPLVGSPTSTFPTLDEQKLADLAWARLGLELEPINDKDLKRVEALGYEGGLRITSIREATRRPSDVMSERLTGDILVGLHAWPTTSLGDVAEILNRDDLAELNPLKYYVVRLGQPSSGGFGSGRPETDGVVTGRIAVSLEKPAVTHGRPAAANSTERPRVVAATPLPIPTIPNAVAAQASLPAEPMFGPAEPVAPPEPAASPDGPSDRNASLRYEGRTFGQWQMDFLNRGSQEANALTALEAFAAAGYGEDATRAILAGPFSPNNLVAKRSRKFLSTLPASEATRLVPKLVEVLETDLATDRRIDAVRALAAFGPPADPALESLKKRLSSSNPRERIAAAAAIKMIVGKDEYQKPVADVLGKELGIEVVESNGAWAAVPRKDANDNGKAFNDFTEAVIKEQQQLFPDGKF